MPYNTTFNYSKNFTVICGVCHYKRCSINPSLSDDILLIASRYCHSGTKVMDDSGVIHDEALIYENGFVEFINHKK